MEAFKVAILNLLVYDGFVCHSSKAEALNNSNVRNSWLQRIKISYIVLV